MENIEFSDWLKEHYDQKPHKQTREEKRAQHDREIIDAFCNFIRADTPEHQSYIRDGGCDVGYLGSHVKKACIPKDLAWECSKPFIMSRYTRSDPDEVKPTFDCCYDLEKEDIRWRRKHFKQNKKK